MHAEVRQKIDYTCAKKAALDRCLDSETHNRPVVRTLPWDHNCRTDPCRTDHILFSYNSSGWWQSCHSQCGLITLNCSKIQDKQSWRWNPSSCHVTVNLMDGNKSVSELITDLQDKSLMTVTPQGSQYVTFILIPNLILLSSRRSWFRILGSAQKSW